MFMLFIFLLRLNHKQKEKKRDRFYKWRDELSHEKNVALWLIKKTHPLNSNWQDDNFVQPSKTALLESQL